MNNNGRFSKLRNLTATSLSLLLAVILVTSQLGMSIAPAHAAGLLADVLPPQAPLQLTVSVGDGKALLNWAASPDTGVIGYNIYRSNNPAASMGIFQMAGYNIYRGQDMPVLLQVPSAAGDGSTSVFSGTKVNEGMVANETSYLDSGLTNGATYYYAVTAVNSEGSETPISAEITAIPALPAGSGIDLEAFSSYIDFNNAEKLKLETFTIETWFRRDGAGIGVTTGKGGIVEAIPLVARGRGLQEDANLDLNYFLGIDTSRNVLAADFEEGSKGANPGRNHPVYGTTTIPMDGEWHYAALSYDGVSLQLFLDGKLDGVAVAANPANAQSKESLLIGGVTSITGLKAGFFDGALDEVRIWDRALSEDEVRSYMNLPLTSAPGLVARWGLDEQSAETATDSVPEQANGILKGTNYTWNAGAPFDINLAPNPPTLVEPGQGAQDVAVPATLTVNASDIEDGPLTVSFYGRKWYPPVGPDFSLIVVPDTQYYAALYTGILKDQVDWIVSQKDGSNIPYVISLGDNVDMMKSAAQWRYVSWAYKRLEAAGIPYGLAVGNHDGGPDKTKLYNSFFGIERFTGMPYYGGHYGEDNDNHFDLFESGTLKFIVLYLEYNPELTSPDDPLLQWANAILSDPAYQDRRAIVVYHDLLRRNPPDSFSPTGQAIYDALKGNPNLFLMLGGHLDVAGQRTDIFDGNTIYSLRSDYQFFENRTSGYLRIMRFSPENNVIHVDTYSPYKDRFYPETEEDYALNKFTIPYEMGGPPPYEFLGTVSIQSGENASIGWDGLEAGTAYDWFAVANDGELDMRSDTFTFTTDLATAP